jgi:hypothetical protein
MYVREKIVRRGKKEYRYFQLVQSTWVEGKSRQTVIRHLGPFGRTEAAEGHARMAGYLCGAAGCFEEPFEKRQAWEQVRGGETREVSVWLCEEHVREMGARGVRAVAYDPEKAKETREIIRKSGRGGRPKRQLQDRDSAMKQTAWDSEE